jgi:pimeloyl-ACP methyl ester carboxylesterase
MSYRQRVSSDQGEPLHEDRVRLIDGLELAVRRAQAPLRPFLLVHDLSADSGCWDQVATRLLTSGHEVAAVDLRGHGRSASPSSGYDTDTCADDLTELLDLLGFTGNRSPVVVGHGWGANVAVSLAARRDGIAGACCLAGGWIRPGWRYPTFEEFWDAYGTADLTGTALEHRRSIARSLFRGEPRGWFPLVNVPVALCPVVPRDGVADPSGGGTATRTGVAEAIARLPQARVSWYYGEGGDVLTDAPTQIVEDLLALAADAEPAID